MPGGVVMPGDGRIEEADGAGGRGTDGVGVRSESATNDGARARIDGIARSESATNDGARGRAAGERSDSGGASDALTCELVLSGAPSPRRTRIFGFAPGGSAAARIGRDSGTPIDSRPPRSANDVDDGMEAGVSSIGASVRSGSVLVRGRSAGPAGRKARGCV